MSEFYKIPLYAMDIKLNGVMLEESLKTSCPSVSSAIIDNNIFNEYLLDENSFDINMLVEKEYYESNVIRALAEENLPFYILAEKIDGNIIEKETNSIISMGKLTKDKYQCSEINYRKNYNEDYINKILNLISLHENNCEEKKTILR